jgi:hypothetical protein
LARQNALRFYVAKACAPRHEDEGFMLIRLIIVALALWLSGCAGIHRMEQTNLPKEDAAILSVPNYWWVHAVDGVKMDNPICGGILCHSGIEVVLSPGVHEIEVQYCFPCRDSVNLTADFEKGVKYKLVNYRIVKQ